MTSIRTLAPAITFGALLLAGCGGAATEREASGSDHESSAAGSSQESVATSAEADPIEGEISWFLPPAGDQSPSNNEDSTYRALQRADAGSCAATLSGVFAEPPPNGFITGDRSYYAFLAGAHLCLGDRESASSAFAQAQSSTWVEPAGVVTASRVCNVWRRVSLMLEGAERSCDLAIGADLEPPENPATPPPVSAPASPSSPPSALPPTDPSAMPSASP
jgi:hypothetical protein